MEYLLNESLKVITYAMKWGIQLKATVEQRLASEERNKSQKAWLWESLSGIHVGELTIWVSSFEIENYNRVHQVYQFQQNRLASPYDGR